MKILHTGDLHIGKNIEGESRIIENYQVLEEITQVVKREKVDLLLIAGDVFDTFNPSAEAENCYYDFLEEVTANNNCGVVVIAGNHDQPERLSAVNALTAKHSIYTLALPNTILDITTLDSARKPHYPIIIASGENWLKLQWVNSMVANIAALPYLSESRIGQLFTKNLTDDSDNNQAYSLQIQELFAKAGVCFKENEINIAMAHLFAVGGKTSDSERSIQVGGSFGVNKNAFPPMAQYVALGHLHRPQQVQAPMPCYYSGSPLACGFAEAGQEKSVILVEVEAGSEAEITKIPLQKGRPLTEKVFSSYDEALSWCSEEENQECWLNIKIHLQSPMTELEIKALRNAHSHLLRMEVILPRKEGENRPNYKEMSISQRFQHFVQDKTGFEADSPLVTLFLQLKEHSIGELEELVLNEIDKEVE